MCQIRVEGQGHSNNCGCGKRNSVDHTLICPNGGYVIMQVEW